MTRIGLIVAGGTGERLGRAGGKQMLEVCGRPLLALTLEVFERCAFIDGTVVVAHPDRVDEYRKHAVDATGVRKVIGVVPGGETRQRSVARGLAALPHHADIVLVHDGARPLVTTTLLDDAVRALETDETLDGIVVGHPVYDTLKLVDQRGLIIGTADRTAFWAAQTPQVFRVPALRAAYDRAERLGETATDDASLVERAGGRVRMIEGPRTNVKVTVPEDVVMIEAILSAREGDTGDE